MRHPRCNSVVLFWWHSSNSLWLDDKEQFLYGYCPNAVICKFFVSVSWLSLTERTGMYVIFNTSLYIYMLYFLAHAISTTTNTISHYDIVIKLHFTWNDVSSATKQTIIDRVISQHHLVAQISRRGRRQRMVLRSDWSAAQPTGHAKTTSSSLDNLSIDSVYMFTSLQVSAHCFEHLWF